MMRVLRRLRGIDIAAVALFLLATAADGATISGSVTASALPFPSAVVSVYSADGFLKASATTDSLGRYSVIVPAATYRVLAYDPAGAFATSFHSNADSFESSTVVDLTTRSAASIDFALLPGAWLRGVVRSRGEPLAAVVVTAWNASGSRRGSATTDITGRYSLVVPTGTYRLGAWDLAGDFVAGFAIGESDYAAADPISITAGEAIAFDFDLAKKAAIHGVVASAVTRSGFAGAIVDVYLAEGVWADRAAAGDDGSYSIKVPPGEYRVVAHELSGTYAASFFDRAESFSTARVIPATDGSTWSGVNFELAVGGHLAGFVRDDRGEPLSQIRVSVFNASGTIRSFTASGADGSWSVLVPPGSYRVAAWDDQMRFIPAFHPAGSTFETALPLTVAASATTSGIDFDLAPAARISGTVTLRGTALPIEGATVALYDLQGKLVHETLTDADGRFLTGGGAGYYKLGAFDRMGRYGKLFFDDAPTFESATVIEITIGMADRMISLQLPVNRRRMVRPANTAPNGASTPTATLPSQRR